MTARDFAYWLNGFFELHDARQAKGDGKKSNRLDAEQTACIRRHLQMVFVHDIDPKAGSAAHQEELNHLHHGGGDGPVMRC